MLIYRFANLQVIIDQSLLEPLSRLSNLTELVLNRVDFAIAHPRLFPLRSLEKLPVANKNSELEELFHQTKRFYTEDPDQPTEYRLNIPEFREILANLFPGMKHLTLIGNVYQHRRAQERLTRELGPSFEQLQLFFRNNRTNRLSRPPLRTTARKSVGAMAPRLAISKAFGKPN